MKRKKKNERAKLKKKLDIMVGTLIRLRDKNTCQYCSKEVTGSNCHVSHVIPKSHGDVLRWDLQNLKVLCYHHHINWWHKNPLEASEWFKNKFPERYEYLETNKNLVMKFSEESLKEMLENYKKLLTSMNG